MEEESIPLREFDDGRQEELPQEQDNYDDRVNYDRDHQETSFSAEQRLNEMDEQIDVPSISRDVGGMKRSFTADKKESIKYFFNEDIKKGNGPNSRELLEKYKVNVGKKGNPTSISYENSKIYTIRDGELVESSTGRGTETRLRFRGKLELARREGRDKRVREFLYEKNEDELEEQMHKDVKETIEFLLERVVEEERQNIDLSVIDDAQDKRELNAVFSDSIFSQEGQTNKEKIEALEVDRIHWRTRMNEEIDSSKKAIYRNAVETIELNQDYLRFEDNEEPKNDAVLDMLEDNIESSDLTTYKRFKEFVKRNFGGLSGAAIGIGGIIATIVVSTRSAVRSVARGAKDASSFLKKVLERVGPLVGTLLNIVAAGLGLTAKALSFLAQNLWMFVIFIAVALINKYKRG